MKGDHPPVFISASSGDLKSVREAVKVALLTLGYFPVEQAHFGPEPRTLVELLRKKIAGSAAVIHIVGERYGAEPEQVAPGQPRRSYTQLEYEFARELKKPLYIFVCGEDFPYDANVPEPDEVRQLQAEHRRRVLGSGQHYHLVSDFPQLDQRVRELQFRIEQAEGMAIGAKRRTSWAIAGTVLALLGLGLGGWWFTRRADVQQQQIAEVRNDLEKYRRTAELLAARYNLAAAPGETLTDEEKYQRALTQIASDQKVAVDDLKKELTIFTAMVRANPAATNYDRALADFAAKAFAASESNAALAVADFRAARLAAGQAKASAEQKEKSAAKGELKALVLQGDAQNAQLKFADAEATYRAACALVDERDAQEWIAAREKLGAVLYVEGKYAESLEVWDQTQAREEALYGAEHTAILEAMSYRGTLLQALDKLAEAEVVFRRAIEISPKIYGPEHAEVATALNNLSVLLDTQGKFDEAEALQRQALAIRTKALGAEHIDVAQSMSNLADVLREQGKLAEAEPLARQALEVYRKTLGEESPDVAVLRNNLAELLRAQGKLAEAEPVAREALAGFRHVLGDEHPNVANSMNNLGIVLQAEGKLAEAEPLILGALQIRRKALGEDHSDVAISLSNVAVLLAAQGKAGEAEPMARQALAISLKVSGEENPASARMMGNLSDVLRDEGKLDEAEAMARRALGIREKLLGEGHAQVAASLMGLARIAEKRGRRDEAERDYRRALAIRLQVLGAEHPDTLKAQQDLTALGTK
jgi:hypothetical protein